jgi:flagellar export protein FliJ
MTIKPRTVRSLLTTRERLRDIAAAHHSRTSLAADRANEHLEHEEDTLDEFLDDAVAALAEVTGVHQLDRLAASQNELQLAVADASAAYAAASAASERSASALRERTKQLRSLERFEERLEKEAASREARAEQTSNDDLAARRR